MPKNTTKESTTTAKEDLNIAITMLILDLKGDGTVSLLADQLGVPRKTLSLALRSCQEMEEKKMSWGEYCEMKQKKSLVDPCETKQKQQDFPPTKISWELTSLIKLADAMGIRVSKLISEAELVQDGLPPWFKKRIKYLAAAPQTKEEFNNIFLEAVGCRTYSNSPAESLDITGKRKSHRGSSEDLFSYDDITHLRFLADFLFERLEQVEQGVFVKAYQAGVLSPQNVYFILKNAIETMCSFLKFKPIPLHRRWRKNEEEDRRSNTIQLIDFLRRNKWHLIDFTTGESRPFLQKEAKN